LVEVADFKETNMGWNPFKISVKASSGKRGTYRAKISGLHVKVVGRPSVYPTTDLSPTGVGLKGSTGMREGKVFELGLFTGGKQIVSGLHARVVRATATFTALVFVDLDPRQSDAVHALVLSEQKRQADERKESRLDGRDKYDMNF